MSKRFFGTDGIRGLIGSEKMHPEFIMHLGWALGKMLQEVYGGGLAIIGKDTRISGYMLESALEAGLSSAGINVSLTGPLPTPGVAYITKTMHAQIGIMVSASHNPFYDNGIKIFSADGTKLSDAQEVIIEKWLEQPMEVLEPANLGKALRLKCAQSRYVEFCKSTAVSKDLSGMRIVMDLANGAAYNTGDRVFTELGANVTVIGNEPDGININHGVGSTHPEVLAKKVKELHADVGIALDGDGDRCIMVDSDGKIIDGDEILYIIAKARKKQGITDKMVVGTVMSNMGIENAIKNLGLEFLRSKVGDKYVLEDLLQHDAVIGGEASGHILCLDKSTTGDGIVASLQVVSAMRQEQTALNEMLLEVEKFPHQLVNIKVDSPQEVVKSDMAQDAVAKFSEQISGRGRILLRASGTESLVRIMVEGSDSKEIKNIANSLADVVRDIKAL